MKSTGFQLSHRFKVWFVWLSVLSTLGLGIYQYKKRTEYWARHISNSMRPQLVQAQALDNDLKSVFNSQAENRQSQRLVLVHFWATWCAPCRSEIPTFGVLQELLGDRIRVVTIATDESQEDILKFFANAQPSFEVLWDDTQATAKNWNIDKYPETFLIMNGKKQMLKFSGPRDWSSQEAIDFLTGQLSELS